MPRERVLFLAHEAARTGPPLVLLAFLRWLHRTEPGLDLHVVVLDEGPLVEAFAELSTVWVVDDPSVRAAGDPDDRVRAQQARLATLPPPDVVVVNTAISGRGLRYLPATDAPVVAVIHELEIGLRQHLAPADLELLVDRCQGFVAPAHCLAANLVERHGIPSERVTVCREFIDLPAELEVEGADANDGSRPLVGGSGVLQWRKGTDLFLQMAAIVRTQVDASFVWLGGPREGPFYDQLQFDTARMGLADVVEFVGVQPDAPTWFGRFDVLAFPSREDSMPLVLLEAGSVGTPVVSFDVGCIGELLGDGRGELVPYPDVPQLAERVVAYLDDADHRQAVGRRLAERVRSHHVTETAAPLMWDAIRAQAA